MTTATAPDLPAVRLRTTEELLQMPDDGVRRWLIRGELREVPMTYRNKWHSEALMTIGYFLMDWLRRQPEPRGRVLGGDAGCRLSRGPDTTVGIDVAYFSADTLANSPADTTIIEGPPVLAVEILSPYDTIDNIGEKREAYLRAGVALVWVVDPYAKTVTAYRPGRPPEMVNVTQELSGEPELPGFRVPVAELFGP